MNLYEALSHATPNKIGRRVAYASEHFSAVRPSRIFSAWIDAAGSVTVMVSHGGEKSEAWRTGHEAIAHALSWTPITEGPRATSEPARRSEAMARDPRAGRKLYFDMGRR